MKDCSYCKYHENTFVGGLGGDLCCDEFYCNKKQKSISFLFNRIRAKYCKYYIESKKGVINNG